MLFRKVVSDSWLQVLQLQQLKMLPLGVGYKKVYEKMLILARVMWNHCLFWTRLSQMPYWTESTQCKLVGEVGVREWKKEALYFLAYLPAPPPQYCTWICHFVQQWLTQNNGISRPRPWILLGWWYIHETYRHNDTVNSLKADTL